MPLWFGLGQAANVVQLPGVDAGGLISMILQAVETVRRNKKECQELAKRVQVIGDLLEQLQDPDMMQEPATRNPLEELEETLRQAYTLVTHCQESNIAYLFCRATRTAKRLREVQDRIMFYVQVFPMVSHVHTTRLRQIRDVPSASDRIGGSEDIGRVPAATMPFTATETPCICSSSAFSKFSFSQLADATNDFSPENQIAKGGFSIFYKGQLQDGLEVAIKRSTVASPGLELVEFENEFRIVWKLQHVNIVKLLGCCIEGSEKILVWEYMPNGSLGDILFGSRTKVSLDWLSRLQIIAGIAQGVDYLHKHEPCIIHRKIKPHNILLDSNMNPKIAAFGMSITVCSYADVVGTFGYVDPQYMLQCAISVKIDVYSFGVMVLEIISGKRFKQASTSDGYNTLIKSAWCSWRKGKFTKFIDPSCKHDGDSAFRKEMKRCIQIALLCIQEKSEDRPAMSDVLQMLNSEKATRLLIPKQPSYTPQIRRQTVTTNPLTDARAYEEEAADPIYKPEGIELELDFDYDVIQEHSSE